MTLHKIKTPPPAIRKRIEEMPKEVLNKISVPLFALMNLTWDYIDTICEICADNRWEGDSKRLTRQLRTLRRDYDSFRAILTDEEFLTEETDRGLSIEERLGGYFRQTFMAVKAEAGRYPALSEEQRMLTVAVLQAVTLMRAVRIYARRCDKVLESYGIWVCDCCMVQTEFLKLDNVVPRMTPWTKWSDSEECKMCATIIANKIEPEKSSWPKPKP